MTTAHERVDSHMTIEGGAGDERRVARTPLNVEAPLVTGRQLVHYLATGNKTSMNTVLKIVFIQYFKIRMPYISQYVYVPHVTGGTFTHRSTDSLQT
jgi:hypothetical protein